MDFEWDEAKRLSNILKHGVDFADAVEVFAGRFTEAEDLRRAYGERRSLVTGRLGDDVLRIVYTWRAERCRLISARRAKRNERRAYYASNVGAGPENEEPH
jgi:uncharacterized protein